MCDRRESATNLLATVKMVSVTMRPLSSFPKATMGLKAEGFRGAVNLLKDTTNESITCDTHTRTDAWSHAWPTDHDAEQLALTEGGFTLQPCCACLAKSKHAIEGCVEWRYQWGHMCLAMEQ